MIADGSNKRDVVVTFRKCHTVSFLTSWGLKLHKPKYWTIRIDFPISLEWVGKMQVTLGVGYRRQGEALPSRPLKWTNTSKQCPVVAAIRWLPEAAVNGAVVLPKPKAQDCLYRCTTHCSKSSARPDNLKLHYHSSWQLEASHKPSWKSRKLGTY